MAERTTDRRRVQLDFSDDAYERFVALKEKTKAKSNAEVVQQGLRLLEWYHTKRQEGFRVLLQKGSETTEIELMF